jgi:glycosyltransferase involved in cell wall biosynthesis
MTPRLGVDPSAQEHRDAALPPRVLPRLCIVGPLLGRHRGHTPAPGETLARLMQEAGYSVIAYSSVRNRTLRLLDIAQTLVRRRDEFDLLVLEVYSGRSFVVQDLVSRLGRALNRPIVMVLHGGSLPEFMARFPRWSRDVLSRATHRVAPSEYLACAAARHGLCVQVIPNGVDVDNYPFRLREVIQPRLFWMRKYHPIYNPEMAVRVLARLRDVQPEATLVMAGPDRGGEAGVRRLVESEGLGDAVRFAGFLDPAGKAREGTAAEIFINTTRIDNMPVTLIEACAMGLPVVSTAVGGVPALLKDGETGLLVPDDDAAAMAGAIERLLADSLLTRRLSRQGRALAEGFDNRRVREQWERLFARLARGAPAARSRAS